VFLATVDGTHCQILEQRQEPDKRWFSHKFDGPGVAYEIATHLTDNKIVWVNGPFKAGKKDLSIFKEPNGLNTVVPPNMMLLGDRGYRGVKCISTPNEFDSDDVNTFKRRARSRQETVNRRIKQFRITSDRFRHPLEKHKIVFEAVCTIVQYILELESPLFDV
jgi:hypothetical protein